MILECLLELFFSGTTMLTGTLASFTGISTTESFSSAVSPQLVDALAADSIKLEGDAPQLPSLLSLTTLMKRQAKQNFFQFKYSFGGPLSKKDVTKRETHLLHYVHS